ncbi:substrate-binding periplasmic protein [Pseudomonas japonica]|uniref:Amino acid ABC transporter substrate-binding protein, PAAT family n=1 Tax=Pseudomonas japonica TaxID=256466 RepID=A0A239AVK5_9PSED|nr:transporter substrate-binding domain-containing protein [Pseudomonas japonica]SNR99362.1 amino acid ABC transporter substrate-binding protein, PAAT family [Pseudomonas japonica]
MSYLARLSIIVLLSCMSLLARAEQLRIVTDPWAPYVYEENGEPKGIDYEVTAEVFRRLGIEVRWEFMPWRRCLLMLEQGLADGVMDIFQTSQRDSQLFYPSEPLSHVEFVLYQANARPHAVDDLEDLRGLNVGTSPGYNYGEAFLESPLFRREAAPTQEANFGKLLLGRIDLLITDRRVGQFMVNQLGLQGQVSELPLVVSRQAQYLAVRRNAGMDLLAQRFAAELRRFKREPAYAELQARYHVVMPNATETVEQQERSTP